jgi:putative beta-lysine N-acetyltransferase
MYDLIEQIGQSFIQHGVHNDRIYLMKLHRGDFPGIIQELLYLANEKKYSKIFCKVPLWAVSEFKKNEFLQEASIPQFYEGETEAVFLSKFMNRTRLQITEEKKEEIEKNIQISLKKQKIPLIIQKNALFSARILTKDDITDLVELYKKVFKTYPFPIHEKSYIKETMNENVIYFGVFKENKLMAVSSSEMDIKSKNAEMTDFATDPEFTGNGFAFLLLREMEAEMRKRKMKTLYTIARSHSAGMNITFAKLEYNFSGTLRNNTNIFGQIESMNIWYKLI